MASRTAEYKRLLSVSKITNIKDFSQDRKNSSNVTEIWEDTSGNVIVQQGGGVNSFDVTLTLDWATDTRSVKEDRMSGTYNVVFVLRKSYGDKLASCLHTNKRHCVQNRRRVFIPLTIARLLSSLVTAKFACSEVVFFFFFSSDNP